MIPWYFNLPADNAEFNSAWKHVIDTSQLLGQFGLRTNEPSYEYYFKQFVMYQGQRGSQWNGPSWPYQSSQVLTGMANFLNNYQQEVITNSDYLHLLRLFARQHFLPDGRLDLVENYDPNLGGPIVYYYWSNHYNHSSFNNLVITGLCGIRPSESDTLLINPLTDSTVSYFCLDGVSYHGHTLTIVYDSDGSRYNCGKGLTVLVDHVKASPFEKEGKYRVAIGSPKVSRPKPLPVNLALNIAMKGFPVPSASVNSVADFLKQAIDGHIWYLPEIRNRWATTGSVTGDDWYAINFGKPQEISSAKVYLYTGDDKFAVPVKIIVEYMKDGEWLPVKNEKFTPRTITGNTVNTITFGKVTASEVRMRFVHPEKQVAVAELEFYQ
jgi:hypothetical protein